MTKANKTVIVTGGGIGLGYQCVKSIATSDPFYHIVIACINPDEASQSIQKLRREIENVNVTIMKLDLASLASIRRFTDEFSNTKLPPLHAIVCNAGLQIVSGMTFTKDEFEMTFGVNYLGHFLLVNILLNKMAEPGRIVFISSGTHDPKQKTGFPKPLYVNAKLLAYPEDATKNQRPVYFGRRRYTTSKLCVLYLTYELARLITNETGKKITVNAFDPGMLPGTGLAKDYNLISRFVWKYILPITTVFLRNVNTVSKSGRALSLLVTNPQLNDTTGKYFEGTKEIKSSDLSYNKVNSLDLWKTSIELVKLKKEETIFLFTGSTIK